ncbi:MAG: hypothetical protein ACOYVE_10425 [Melioribacter sp.]|uniref:hypothetical protein n=1 Tax=Melioribacter sp. TaxID=2052167 RepID=UPI003BC222BD
MEKDVQINQSALEIFEEIFKSEKGIPERWLFYCVKQLIFYKINKREYYKTPEDIVSEIIFSAINGKRKWNTEEVPVEAFVRSCIKSVVSHLAEGMDNKKVDDIIINQKQGISIDALENAHDKSKQQIELLYENKDLIERCREVLQEDTEMGLVFELILEGRTPKEMEAEYGIPPDKVDAVKKRIKRCLKKIFKEEDYNN